MVVGQSVHTWEQDGFSYRIQAVTETTGLAALFKPARVLQKSEGAVVAEGLRPRDFRHDRVGATDTAAFDWERRVVAYEGRESPILPGAQDMLSMYYQMALDVARGGVREMQIATGRKVDRYVFEPVGEESIAVPGGSRRALRVRTRSVAGGDSIELWLDPERIGAPLRIRYVDRRGDLYDQSLDEYEIGEAATR